MSTLGNILWFILGGEIVALLYFISGLLMCCTVVGIPFGLQLWKLAAFACCPFGKDVEVKENAGCLSIGFSVLWVICNWWEIALVHLLKLELVVYVISAGLNDHNAITHLLTSVGGDYIEVCNLDKSAKLSDNSFNRQLLGALQKV